MGREEEIINERKRKIEELKKSGINPYPHRFNNFGQKSFSIDIQQEYSDILLGYHW